MNAYQKALADMDNPEREVARCVEIIGSPEDPFCANLAPYIYGGRSLCLEHLRLACGGSILLAQGSKST